VSRRVGAGRPPNSDFGLVSKEDLAASKLYRAQAAHVLRVMRVERLAAQEARDILHVRYARHYAAAVRGQIPAEALPTELREDLVDQLAAQGASDVEIATRTHLSTYTVHRIRTRALSPTDTRLPAADLPRSA
jgi:DNA-binding NarL/FixJ family response regulator